MPDDVLTAVCAVGELRTAEKVVVDVGATSVLVMWNGGDPIAMNDTCIHRGRSLSEGVVFAGRLVCAGHQWAFDLKTGYCKARDQYQPVYRVVVDGNAVLVAVTEPATRTEADPLSGLG